MVYNDKQWRSLFKAIGQPDVFEADRRFATQGSRLEHIVHVDGTLSRIVLTRTTNEWLSLCEKADIPPPHPWTT